MSRWQTYQEPEPKTLIQLTDGGYNPLAVWWYIMIKPLLTWRRPV